MNRVRVVAVTAVVLGAAVVAGTKFQETREMAGATAQQASVVPASQIALAPTARAASGASSDQTAEVAQAAVTLSNDTPPDGSPSMVTLTAARSDMAAPSTGPTIAFDPSTPAVPNAPVPNVIVPRVSTASILPASELASTSQQADQDAAPAELVTTEDQTPIVPLDSTLQSELDACAVWVVVTPSTGAMLDASVYAPCDRNADVLVSHAGLSFDAHIGGDGRVNLLVPALVDEATLTVTFNDGRTQSDTTFVPDLNTVERVALQWTGPAELSLHAYEFGAQFGDAGHVYADNPRSPDVQGHGFLTTLGEPQVEGGHMVQVYSYPSGQSSRTGTVSLEIEAPITAANCGAPLTAESIEMRAAAAVRTRDIRLDMPACDGAGGYVVMPGVLPDLQIAALR